jgi:hypothetical protein
VDQLRRVRLAHVVRVLLAEKRPRLHVAAQVEIESQCWKLFMIFHPMRVSSAETIAVFAPEEGRVASTGLGYVSRQNDRVL